MDNFIDATSDEELLKISCFIRIEIRKTFDDLVAEIFVGGKFSDQDFGRLAVTDNDDTPDSNPLLVKHLANS